MPDSDSNPAPLTPVEIDEARRLAEKVAGENADSEWTRDMLASAQDWILRLLADRARLETEISDLRAALSSDAGKGWLSPEAAEKRVADLEMRARQDADIAAAVDARCERAEARCADLEVERDRLKAALARATDCLRTLTQADRCICRADGGVLGCPVHYPVGDVAAVLSDPDGARALAERRTMERCSEILRHALATGHIGHPGDVQEATTALAAIDAARGKEAVK